MLLLFMLYCLALVYSSVPELYHLLGHAMPFFVIVVIYVYKPETILEMIRDRPSNCVQHHTGTRRPHSHHTLNIEFNGALEAVAWRQQSS